MVVGTAHKLTTLIMKTFYFPIEPVPFIRRALIDQPESEIRDAESALYAYLDLVLRVYEDSQTKDEEV